MSRRWWLLAVASLGCLGTPRGGLLPSDASTDDAPTHDVTSPDVVAPAQDVVASPDVIVSPDVVAPPDVPAATDVVAPPDVPAPTDVVVTSDVPAIVDAPLPRDVPVILDTPTVDVVSPDAGPRDVPVADAPADVSPDVPTGCPTGMLDCGRGCVDVSANPSACGACGRACPGLGLSSSTATCASGVCALACVGDQYDVDGDPANGCEVTDDSFGGHTQATASSRVSLPCDDGTRDTITGAMIVSDARAHSPAPPGFDATVGAAPDWYATNARGGSLCANNYGITFSTTGGGDVACYRCTIITNRTTDSVLANGHTTVMLTNAGIGLYNDGTTVYLRVDRVCSPPTPERVSYTVQYHL